MPLIHRKHPIVQWGLFFLRTGFGFLLVYASLDKILHPSDFAQMTENYRVIGKDLSNWVAVFIPYLEIVVGLLLLAGIWLDAASMINMILMFVFFVLVLQAYFRGLDISCGCYSVEEGHVIGPVKLLTNFIYVLLSALLVKAVFKPFREAQHAKNESPDQAEG